MVVSKRAGGDIDVRATTGNRTKKSKPLLEYEDPYEALCKAARTNDLESLEQLLNEVGCDALSNDNIDGKTPLYEAAECGHLEVAKLLLERGWDVNGLSTVGERFETALMIAADKGHLALVQCLLVGGASLMDTRTSGSVYSPLQRAAASGHLPVVQRLLEAGANCNYKVGSETALMRAAESGHVQVVECLLEAGSSHMVSYQSPLVDAFNGFPHCEASVLCAAAAGGHTQVVLRVYNHAMDQLGGLQVDIDELSDNLHQLLVLRTPLMAAAANGHLDTVVQLLELHSNVDRECRDPEDGSVVPVEQAAKYGHVDVVRALLEAGSAIRLDKAVVKASRNRKWDVVRLILGTAREPAPLRKLALLTAIQVATHSCAHCNDDGVEDIAEEIMRGDPHVARGAKPDLLLAAAVHSQHMLERVLEAGGRWEAQAIARALEEAATDKKFVALQSMLSCGLSCDGIYEPKVVLEVAKRAPHLLPIMIQAGLKLDVADTYCRTAVSMCFNRRDYSTMERLMDSGASTRCLKATQLLELVRLKSDFLIKVLRAGADPTQQDAQNHIAFVRARCLKHSARDGQLYNRLLGAARQDATIANRFFVGCCHKPIELQEELRQLLKLPDIDVNFQHPVTGATPLVALVLANRNHTDIAGKCISIIKDLISLKKADINAPSSCTDGMPPLLAATTVTQSRTAWHDFVAQIIQLGAHVNARDAYNRTALHHAADWPMNKKKQKTALQVARVLLENGADPEMARWDGKTALMVAAERNFASMVDLLIRHRVDVNRRVPLPCSRETLVKSAAPLLNAASGSLPDSSSGPQAGATMNVAVDKNYIPFPGGCSALLLAAANNAGECVKILLDNGAEVNAVDGQGITALFKACDKGYHSVADLLIRGGADVNMMDTHGWTPLMYAAKGNFKNLARRLRIGGASGTLKNPQGQTAYDIALACKHHELAVLVRERA